MLGDASATKRFSVLVVDDEVMMTRTAAYILGKTYTVTCANSLSEGQSAVRAGTFDAALVDDRMPDGRGPELLSTLAQLQPACLRYLVTANLGIEDELDPSFFREVVLIHKPVNMHAFLPTLDLALRSTICGAGP